MRTSRREFASASMIAPRELYSEGRVRDFYVVVLDFVVLKAIHLRKRRTILFTKYEFGELEYVKFLKFLLGQIMLERQWCKECASPFGLSAIECYFRFTAHRFTTTRVFPRYATPAPRAIVLAGSTVTSQWLVRLTAAARGPDAPPHIEEARYRTGLALLCLFETCGNWLGARLWPRQGSRRRRPAPLRCQAAAEVEPGSDQERHRKPRAAPYPGRQVETFGGAIDARVRLLLLIVSLVGPARRWT
jgi:hypothetical protein